jgi:hypothetical protein
VLVLTSENVLVAETLNRSRPEVKREFLACSSQYPYDVASETIPPLA